MFQTTCPDLSSYVDFLQILATRRRAANGHRGEWARGIVLGAVPITYSEGEQQHRTRQEQRIQLPKITAIRSPNREWTTLAGPMDYCPQLDR